MTTRKSATDDTVAALRALPVTVRATKLRTPLSLEILIAGFALVALLVAQWMLSAAIQGTNYYGVDGKMAQATILTAFEFGSRFEINNISPIEGVGSQLLPMNVWANPAYWPFALVDKELATDLSAMVGSQFSRPPPTSWRAASTYPS